VIRQRSWINYWLCASVWMAGNLAHAAGIETRGANAWPTRNHLRVAVTVDMPRGTPILATETLPSEFNPDSVRVVGVLPT